MLTRMREQGRAVVLKVFRAACLRRGDKGRNDRTFLEGLHYFTVQYHHLAGAAHRVRRLEQCLEALLAAEPIRRIRSVLPGISGDEPDGAPGANVRQHGGPGTRLGGRRQRGQHAQALGRSRGGSSTKIHLKADLGGPPLAFPLTGGETSDSRQFEILLDIGPDITLRAALTDKGYDAEPNRQAARERHICPVISYRANAKYRPAFFPKTLYKGRARIEQTMGKLKRFKRIALRCEETAENYAALISFACSLILVKSVHTT